MAASPDGASYDSLCCSKNPDQVDDEKNRASQHQQAKKPWLPKTKVVRRKLAFRGIFAESIGPADGRPEVIPRRDQNTLDNGCPRQEPDQEIHQQQTGQNMK